MARSRDEIMEEMLADMPDTYDKTVGSPFYETQKPTAIQLEKLEAEQSAVLNNAFFETASDEEKKTIAKDRANIEIKPATKATGIVKITGTAGAAVTTGDKVASDVVTFTITETKIIPENGVVEVQAECDTEGPAGNVPVGAIKTFPVTISGLGSVTNEEAFAGGYEQESMEEFGERYYDKIRNPATSGNANHYIQWAKETPGVGDAKAYECTPKRGYVTVVIIDAEKKAASEALCEKTWNHIEECRPVGATPIIQSAEELQIQISVKLIVEDTSKDYQELLEKALEKFLANLAFKQNYISYALLGDMILSIPGVLDHQNLTMNGLKENVSIGDKQVAVSGGVTIEE